MIKLITVGLTVTHGQATIVKIKGLLATDSRIKKHLVLVMKFEDQRIIGN